jgi:hypothetical protein
VPVCIRKHDKTNLNSENYFFLTFYIYRSVRDFRDRGGYKLKEFAHHISQIVPFGIAFKSNLIPVGL